MQKVFFDTEFTDFRSPLLLSVGLVPERGTVGCYVELLDDRRRGAASPFVLDNIIPMLGHEPGAAAASLAELGGRVAEFLAGFTGDVELCYDYNTDWLLLEEALRVSGQWSRIGGRILATNIADMVCSPECQAAEAAHFESAATGEPPHARHHALVDACALRARWLVRPALDTTTFGRARAFLGYGEPDFRGRTLSDILYMKSDWWESERDFIRSLFPSDERSLGNADLSPAPAPAQQVSVMTLAEFDALGADERVRRGVERARARLLSHLGLGLGEDGHLVTGSGWSASREHWSMHPDHNDMRVSRMLRCLRLIGLGESAEVMFIDLQKLLISRRGADIAQHTLKFWRDAAYGKGG